MAALEAKKNGDKTLALQHMKTMKQLEMLIPAVESGQAIDLESLPGPPGSSGNYKPFYTLM